MESHALRAMVAGTVTRRCRARPATTAAVATATQAAPPPAPATGCCASVCPCRLSRRLSHLRRRRRPLPHLRPRFPRLRPLCRPSTTSLLQASARTPSPPSKTARRRRRSSGWGTARKRGCRRTLGVASLQLILRGPLRLLQLILRRVRSLQLHIQLRLRPRLAEPSAAEPAAASVRAGDSARHHRERRRVRNRA